VRFIHFALFDGTLLSPHYYAVDAAIAILFAGLGFHVTRRSQMARQYGFLERRVPPSGARQDAAP
jgi:hypothetical protein